MGSCLFVFGLSAMNPQIVLARKVDSGQAGEPLSPEVSRVDLGSARVLGAAVRGSEHWLLASPWKEF